MWPLSEPRNVVKLSSCILLHSICIRPNMKWPSSCKVCTSTYFITNVYMQSLTQALCCWVHVILYAFLSSTDFFQNQLFGKKNQEYIASDSKLENHCTRSVHSSRGGCSLRVNKIEYLAGKKVIFWSIFYFWKYSSQITVTYKSICVSA